MTRITNAQIEAALEHGVDIKGRRIWLHGDVGEETIGRAIRGLYLLDWQSHGRIELYVTSYGGDLDESFALHDVIMTLDSPVHTVALGKCQSAAPLIVAAGAAGHRWASENASLMLHEPKLELGEGEDFPSNIKSAADATRDATRRYAQLLERYTKKDARFWSNIFSSKADRFFGAEQAREWGVIDSIWDQKNGE